MGSRSLADLQPEVAQAARAWLAECDRAGLDILVYCTLRSIEEQERLYARGRTEPGKIVTNARGGESWHNFGRALDFVPLRAGKPVWGTSGDDWALWERAGLLAEKHGFEWSGRWRGSLREVGHIQMTGGLTLAQAREQLLGTA